MRICVSRKDISENFFRWKVLEFDFLPIPRKKSEKILKMKKLEKKSQKRPLKVFFCKTVICVSRNDISENFFRWKVLEFDFLPIPRKKSEKILKMTEI